tara:strand:- start:12 stop:659 length:648 start_codon:yes stop_codon:yes gene_type:complete
MQEQAYPHERDAFASLNISKNKKFNKRDGSKIIRDICKKLLKNKYENDPNMHIESERELQQLEQACLEFNLSTEEKEKLRRKIHKSYEKRIDDKISYDMMNWTDWATLSHEAHASRPAPLSFANKSLKYAFTENGDLIIYSSCYNYYKEEMELIEDVLTRSDYGITSFKKTHPSRSGVCYKDLWRINEDEYIGHYDGGTVHRGTIVGFIIHNNNV